RPGDDPLLKRLWGEKYADAVMPGGEKRLYGYVGELRLDDGRLVTASMFPDRIGCGVNKCPVAILIDDKIVHQSVLLCAVFDINILKTGEILKSCGEEISLASGQ